MKFVDALEPAVGMALLALIAWLILLAGEAHAAPFLVADPYPSSGMQPDAFTYTSDGGSAQPCTMVTVSGGVQPKCDLAGLSAGTHTLVVSATKASTCTSGTGSGNCTTYTPGVSTPFAYTSVTVAAPAPTGSKLSPQ